MELKCNLLKHLFKLPFSSRVFSQCEFVLVKRALKTNAIRKICIEISQRTIPTVECYLESEGLAENKFGGQTPRGWNEWKNRQPEFQRWRRPFYYTIAHFTVRTSTLVEMKWSRNAVFTDNQNNCKPIGRRKWETGESICGTTSAGGKQSQA